MIKKILIAGAGIGGLTAASCLMKAGYDVAVYEQAPELSEIGAGIQISANAMHVLNHLGLDEAIAKLSVRPGAYVFRLHDTGEVIGQFPLADEHERLHGAPYNQLHRADLHDLLATKAREFNKDVVRLNSRVAGFEETDAGVELLFADGSRARGDLLIGADGVKSAVRAQIAGADHAAYTGDAAWRLTLPTDQLPDNFMGQVMSVWMGPGRHVVCYYLRGGALLNFVGLVETEEISEESWTAKFPWERLKADFAGWHEDIQTVIDRTDRDSALSLVALLPAANYDVEHASRDIARRCSACDLALSRPGCRDGDRRRRRADARFAGDRFRGRCSAAVRTQPDRSDFAHCQRGGRQPHAVSHARSKETAP